MSLGDYFSTWQDAWALVLRPLAIGSALCICAGLLSVLVVLKRLGFAGQGISHSAFGGIGLAAVIGAAWGGFGIGGGGLLEWGVVSLFCIGAALAMGSAVDRRSAHEDTGIGILLVASMALGGVLVEAARQIAAARGVAASPRSWESVLFGSIMVSDNQDVLIAWATCALVIVVLALVRRPLLFWAVDELSAPAFGVRPTLMRGVLMALLAVAVVASMRLAGVVPATAMLILPGAVALRLCRRLGWVLVLSVAIGLGGLIAGLGAALAMNLQPGPAMVLVLTGAYFVAVAAGRRKNRA